MNEPIELEITGTGAEMEGVAHIDGMAVFVPGALPGERVRAHIVKRTSKYAHAHLDEIIVPSEHRCAPQCPHAGECGGCSLMYMEYNAALTAKGQHIRDCLKHIGSGDDVLRAMHGMTKPTSYRNRAQFPIGGKAGAPKVGFYREGTHDVIDLPQGCMLLKPELNHARAVFAGWLRNSRLEPYNERTHMGLVRHAVFRTNRQGAFMAIIVINGSKLPGYDKLWHALERIGCVSLMLNIQTEIPSARRTTDVFGKTFINLCGEDHYIDEILDCRFELSAPSFFQVNPQMTDELYSIAVKAAELKDGETLLDAYCGAGTIGLTMLKHINAYHSRLIGIESIPEAVENARRNARLNCIENARFICGRCERELKRLVEKGMCPDVAVIDPPRKGCDEALLNALGELGKRTLKRIVYISCNPATLARDIKRLREMGWEAQWAEGVDMFAWTTHVETVCLLVRRNGLHIDTDVDVE